MINKTFFEVRSSPSYKSAHKTFFKKTNFHMYSVYKIHPRRPHQSESNAKAETFFKVVNVLIQWENVENHRRKYEAGE